MENGIHAKITKFGQRALLFSAAFCREKELVIMYVLLVLLTCIELWQLMFMFMIPSFSDEEAIGASSRKEFRLQYFQITLLNLDQLSEA